MNKKAVIVQSCYIPWKGYFDLINMADEFILYDDTQYTRRDWRNRNIIKTANGLLWLTVPVTVKGRYLQRICDTRINDPDWGEKHWKTIRHNYSKARYFTEYQAVFEDLYLGGKEEYLSRVNCNFIKAICAILGIRTNITWAMDYRLPDGGDFRKTERLVALCKAANATHYLSGPSARQYLVKELFDQEGIELSYMDYAGYPEYTQFHGKFEHGVSVIDLIFHEGPNAAGFMKSFQP